jgi:PTS system ascorbate-specific IIC component
MIGALIQRKTFSKTIVSVFKVIIGFLIMGGGAGVLVGSLNKFQPVFQATYGLSGVIPNNDGLAGAMVGALPSIVSLASIIMILGMIMNLVLATFSRFKYVYLSGHVLYYMSISLALIMYTSGMDFENSSSDYAISVISGASIMGLYMVISPATQQRYMKEIVGNNEIALGHTGGFGYAFSGFLGETISKFSKKKLLSTEEIKFPKSLYFFRNTLVSISITVMIFYMFAFIPGGIMFELGKSKFAEGTDAFNVLNANN